MVKHLPCKHHEFDRQGHCICKCNPRETTKWAVFGEPQQSAGHMVITTRREREWARNVSIMRRKSEDLLYYSETEETRNQVQHVKILGQLNPQCFSEPFVSLYLLCGVRDWTLGLIHTRQGLSTAEVPPGTDISVVICQQFQMFQTIDRLTVAICLLIVYCFVES